MSKVDQTQSERHEIERAEDEVVDIPEATRERLIALERGIRPEDEDPGLNAMLELVADDVPELPHPELRSLRDEVAALEATLADDLPMTEEEEDSEEDSKEDLSEAVTLPRIVLAELLNKKGAEENVAESSPAKPRTPLDIQNEQNQLLIRRQLHDTHPLRRPVTLTLPVSRRRQKAEPDPKKSKNRFTRHD